MRIAFAGLLGAIAMFVFTSIAHLATPLGQTGVRPMPNESRVLAELSASLGGQTAVYLFPNFDSGRRDAMAAYTAKLAQEPNGFLVYHPPGARPMQARQFVVEFLTELAEALIATFVVASTAIAGYWGRVGLAMIVGLAGAVTTNVSYWNWYGFPTDYTVAFSVIEIGGYIAAGLVIAMALRNPRETAEVPARQH